MKFNSTIQWHSYKVIYTVGLRKSGTCVIRHFSNSTRLSCGLTSSARRQRGALFAYLIVSLLKCDGEGRESVLRCEALVGTRGQEETDHRVVVLLRRHVQRGEPMLALNVHSTALLNQNLHNLILKIGKERRLRLT